MSDIMDYVNILSESMKPMAYVANANGEWTIFFATPREAAEAMAGFGPHRVNRVPEYDVFYESGHVPSEILLDDGWQMNCFECGRRIDCTANRRDLVFGRHRIWCTKSCKTTWDERRRKK